MSVESYKNKLIEQIKEAYAQCSENYVTKEDAIDESMVGLKLFEEPIVAFGSAADSLFEECKKSQSVGPWHWMPSEWLTGAKTVVALFFPFSEQIKSDNRPLKNRPSHAWLHGRIEGQFYLNTYMRCLKERLAEEGIQSCVPAIDGRFKTVMAGNAGENYGPQSEQIYGSNWSERHAAYICGLGTFGLSKGLITEKGVAWRFASIIIDAEIEPTKRNYSDPYEYCTKCGACIVRCPVDAITLEDGKNHKICSDWLDVMGERYKPRYGCGLCQTRVPCESRIPDRKA